MPKPSSARTMKSVGGNMVIQSSGEATNTHTSGKGPVYPLVSDLGMAMLRTSTRIVGLSRFHSKAPKNRTAAPSECPQKRKVQFLQSVGRLLTTMFRKVCHDCRKNV